MRNWKLDGRVKVAERDMRKFAPSQLLSASVLQGTGVISLLSGAWSQDVEYSPALPCMGCLAEQVPQPPRALLEKDSKQVQVMKFQ